MYAAPTGQQGLAYIPYISDGETYKQHFAVKHVFDSQPFHIIGPIRSHQRSPQEGEGEMAVKLISPTEGAVERAEEEKKREDKEQKKQKILQSFVGGGARKRVKSASMKKRTSKVKRLGTKSRISKKHKSSTARKTKPKKKTVKKKKVKSQSQSRGKSILKRKK